VTLAANRTGTNSARWVSGPTALYDADARRVRRPAAHSAWLTRAARHLVAFAVVVATACVLCGCAAMPDERRATFGLDFRTPETDLGPTAIVFMVDGVNADVFRQMLDGGRLPNIRKYFVDRGLFIERCVVNAPSTTLVNETSLVTGLFAGRHGIVGNTWFDRGRLIHRNYEELAEKNLVDADYVVTTLFEQLSDMTTMSLFYQVHRGATRFAENRLSAAPPYGFGWYGLVDRIALWRFDLVAQAARAQGRFPALVVAYLLSPDMEAYRSGVSSDAYTAALEHSDAHIGRILRDLETAGRLDRTVLALVSDHGMMDVDRHWPIRRFFRGELHLAVAMERPSEQTPLENRVAYYKNITCVVAGSGDRYAAVYLRKPRAGAGGGMPTPPSRGHDAMFENWLVRPAPEDLRAYPSDGCGPVDIIERLTAAEAVDLVAYRTGPGVVRLVTRGGSAEASRAADGSRRYALRTLVGDDPLGYRETVRAAMLDGTPHDQGEWLAATAESLYPDLVPQIVTYFDAPRAGDILVFAAPIWDFASGNKAGHGGLRPGEMFTIFAAAGPGVPHERTRGPIRSVDMMPTILQLLGRPIPPGLDGRSILGK
jgi:arylsulfatase A-like enzyme